MAFQVSPGVAIREIDLTNVVPAVSTSIGAVVITGTKGPIEEIVTITSEKELVDMFGVPTDDTAAYFFNAAAFLKYGNNLKVVRAASSLTISCGISLSLPQPALCPRPKLILFPLADQQKSRDRFGYGRVLTP